MADEIKVSGSIRVSNTTLSLTHSLPNLTPDQATEFYSSGCQTIGTSEEAIVFAGDLTAAGWCYFRNLDATNFVEVGLTKAATFYPFVKLLPGEWALFRLSTVTDVQAKADTAAVPLEHVLLDA